MTLEVAQQSQSQLDRTVGRRNCLGIPGPAANTSVRNRAQSIVREFADRALHRVDKRLEVSGDRCRAGGTG